MSTQSDRKPPTSFSVDATQPSDAPPSVVHSPILTEDDGSASPDPLLGQLLGNLQVTELLGEGGFGKVYKAVDTVLQRPVAIKYLKETLESKSNVLFRREAKALAALSQHPNIVTIHQWGEYEGHPYFVLEFIEQATDKLLADFPEGLPVAMALRITAECADALQAAHDQGILHRDIKPANILLEGPNHHVKLADFGLARLGDPSESFTISNTLSGSPPYMSPEQAKGEPLDHRTDIFSLGVSLYQLLSGSRLYEGKTSAQVVDNVRNDVRVELRERRADLPPFVYEIVEKATAVRLSERIQSAQDLSEVLRDALAEFEHRMAAERGTQQVPAETMPSPEASAGAPSRERASGHGGSRRNFLIGGVGLLALGLVAGLAAFLLGSSGETPSRRDGASPKAIIDYFCNAWARENYEGMYHALYGVKRDDVSFTEWKGLVMKESERVGIPKSHTIEGPLEELEDRSMWKVNITYLNANVGTLTKTTWVVKDSDGWRIGRGGLSGIALNQFGPRKTESGGRINTFGPQ